MVYATIRRLPTADPTLDERRLNLVTLTANRNKIRTCDFTAIYIYV